MPDRTAKQVIEEHAAELLAIDGVEGVYEGLRGDGVTVIKILVTGTDAVSGVLPETLDGYPVEIDTSGKLKPLADNGPA